VHIYQHVEKYANEPEATVKQFRVVLVILFQFRFARESVRNKT